MKKISRMLLLLCIASMFVLPTALADEAGYIGEWVCDAVDVGDGVRLTRYEGILAADLMTINFTEDGTLTLIAQGTSLKGTWTEAKDGLISVIDGQDVLFTMADGQLVNDSEGTLIYLKKVEQKRAQGLLGLLNVGIYTGKWVATGYDSGDGVIQTRYRGDHIANFMALEIRQDGTMVMDSKEIDKSGTWKRDANGIAVTVEGDEMNATLRDEELLFGNGLWIIYFGRSDS